MNISSSDNDIMAEVHLASKKHSQGKFSNWIRDRRGTGFFPIETIN